MWLGGELVLLCGDKSALVDCVVLLSVSRRCWQPGEGDRAKGRRR